MGSADISAIHISRCCLQPKDPNFGSGSHLSELSGKRSEKLDC